jgi:hypothetical protein
LHDPKPLDIARLNPNTGKPPIIPNPDTVDNDHGRGSVDPVSLIYLRIVGISQKPNFIRVNYLQT